MSVTNRGVIVKYWKCYAIFITVCSLHNINTYINSCFWHLFAFSPVLWINMETAGGVTMSHGTKIRYYTAFSGICFVLFCFAWLGTHTSAPLSTSTNIKILNLPEHSSADTPSSSAQTRLCSVCGDCEGERHQSNSGMSSSPEEHRRLLNRWFKQMKKKKWWAWRKKNDSYSWCFFIVFSKSGIKCLTLEALFSLFP